MLRSELVVKLQLGALGISVRHQHRYPKDVIHHVVTTIKKAIRIKRPTELTGGCFNYLRRDCTEPAAAVFQSVDDTLFFAFKQVFRLRAV